MVVPKCCKFYRRVAQGDQYLLCNGKKANFSEHCSYFWARVNCKKCLAKRKEYAGRR